MNVASKPRPADVAPDCDQILKQLATVAVDVEGAAVTLAQPFEAFDRWSEAIGRDLGSDYGFPASLVGALLNSAVDRLPVDSALKLVIEEAQVAGLAAPSQHRLAVTVDGPVRAAQQPVVTVWLEDLARAQGDVAGLVLSARFEIAEASGAKLAHGTADWLLAESAMAPAARGAWPQPPINRDNQFWWDAADAGKLFIQKCGECATLRHPPGPMCPHCNSTRWDTIEASGRGKVYSYTIHHARFGDLTSPYIVLLVDLEEGVRFVANLVGSREVEIGMPVRMTFRKPHPGERQVPQFVRADAPVDEDGVVVGAVWPGRTVQVSPALATAGAVAMGNFAPLHLDAAHTRKLGWRDVVLDDASALALAESYLHGQDAVGRVQACTVQYGCPIAAGTAVALSGEFVDESAGRRITVTAESVQGTHLVVEFITYPQEPAQ